METRTVKIWLFGNKKLEHSSRRRSFKAILSTTSSIPGRKSIDGSPVFRVIEASVPESIVCRTVSLTWPEDTNDLHAFHQLKNNGRVTLDFQDKRWKRLIHIKRKFLQNKSLQLCQLKLSHNLSSARVCAMKINRWNSNGAN